jgi:hypothetical protein
MTEIVKDRYENRPEISELVCNSKASITNKINDLGNSETQETSSKRNVLTSSHLAAGRPTDENPVISLNLIFYPRQILTSKRNVFLIRVKLCLTAD